jgi:hypothetical protein
MERLSDVFGRKRRQGSRVAVQLRVDVPVAGTDHFLCFFTRDMRVSGLCLQGPTSEGVEPVRSLNRSVPMRVRLPALHGTVDFEAALEWEREEEGQLLTGWTLTRISGEARKAINAYIEDHPEEVLKDPSEGK